MSDEIKNGITDEPEDFKKLLEANAVKVPAVGELVTGTVISASKAEVKLDIDGLMTGVVRGPEMYEEDDDYANLKTGDEVEATVIDTENEKGELELSFRFAGQERAWAGLKTAYEDRKPIKIRVMDANKGGLLVKYRQISGFLPVSQLAPENYPRINGGDKSKILEKLKSFVGKEFEVKVMTLEEKEDKIIFSEKEAWNEKQRDVISKYGVGTIVEGKITAITDFGVFVSFGENLEGLIHISELAWQRIDNPNDLFKVGDIVKAEVISLENAKIFLSAKKLVKDPWQEVDKKYKVKQIVKGKVLKVNPFGLFVKLDEDIHGLAHISQLGLEPKERINDKFRADENLDFEIVSIEPNEHRLGLAIASKKADVRVKTNEVAQAKLGEKPTGKMGAISSGKKKEEIKEVLKKETDKPVKTKAKTEAKKSEKKKAVVKVKARK